MTYNYSINNSKIQKNLVLSVIEIILRFYIKSSYDKLNCTVHIKRFQSENISEESYVVIIFSLFPIITLDITCFY